MLSTGLIEPDAKMSRAKHHLDALEAIRKAFIESDPQRIITEDDLKAQEHIVKITVLGPPPESILVFGDAVSCMRSALDYLAWQLALLATDKPSRDICFPVISQNTVDAQVQFTKQTFGIPDEAIAIMKTLQPYHAGNKFKRHHLWRINKLWNVVKHRHLGHHGTIIQTSLPPGYAPIEVKFVDNHAIVRYPISSRPDVSLYPKQPFIDIQFGDKREDVITDLSDLDDIYGFIGTVVFPQFKRFFP